MSTPEASRPAARRPSARSQRGPAPTRSTGRATRWHPRRGSVAHCGGNLDGDRLPIQFASVDRRRRAVAEERRIRVVEREHRRRRIQRVPDCGAGCACTPALESANRSAATYSESTLSLSCFAAWIAATLLPSFEAWRMSWSSLLCAHADTHRPMHARPAHTERGRDAAEG